MSKMSEMDMMVQEAVEMVEAGEYLSYAMRKVQAEWALDTEEYYAVYREANDRVYGAAA